MKKITILAFIILILATSNVYADYYSELISKINCISKQRKQREPISVKLKGHKGESIIIYNTSIIKIKEKKPKE